jgi:uncharacterized protein (DUF2147 family)
MRYIFKILASMIVMLLAMIVSPSASAEVSPVGYWKTMSDANNTPKGIIQINQEPSGKLAGIVLGGLTKIGDKEMFRCTVCNDSTHDESTGHGLRRDQVIIGSTVMWGYTKDGDEWDDGCIVDTTTGKDYRSSIGLSKIGDELNPNILNVTGKVLFFSRTQHWLRIKNVAELKKLCKKNSTPGFTANCDTKYQ